MSVRLGTLLPCAAAICALGLTISSARAGNPRDAVRVWREAHEKAIVADFVTFLAMPNVATNVADVERNAAYIQGQLNARGFETRLLTAEPGTPPSVFAEMKVPRAIRTVIFYAHYDGQPIGQRGWISDPFQPSMRTALPEAKAVDWQNSIGPLDPAWRLFARSAGDDKASIQAMLSALDALKGDLLIMGDGPMHQSGKQMVNFGNRGIASLTMTVYGPTRPMHDGHYGSWIPSPAVMIAEPSRGRRPYPHSPLLR